MMSVGLWSCFQSSCFPYNDQKISWSTPHGYLATQLTNQPTDQPTNPASFY